VNPIKAMLRIYWLGCSDGRHLFVANQFLDFAAIDLSTMERVASMDDGFRPLHVKLVQQNCQSLVAVLGGFGGNNVLFLVDASDLANLQVLLYWISVLIPSISPATLFIFLPASTRTPVIWARGFRGQIT